MIKQKRGDTTAYTIFLMVELVLFGVSALILIHTLSLIGETSFEKTFIAKDLALVINAIHASPGDVEYTYSMKGYDFEVSISEGYVRVADKGNKEPLRYRFVEKEGEEIEDFNADGATAINFVKKDGKIKITATH